MGECLNNSGSGVGLTLRAVPGDALARNPGSVGKLDVITVEDDVRDPDALSHVSNGRRRSDPGSRRTGPRPGPAH